MSVVDGRDRRAERAEATRREILDAAWALVRQEGLSALTMRELGARVGLRAQSLYAYFASKTRDLRRHVRRGQPRTGGPLAGGCRGGSAGTVAVLRRRNAAFLQFCAEDPVRHQLLFQRTIPGFEPARSRTRRQWKAWRTCTAGCGPAAWMTLGPGMCGRRWPRGLAAQQNANEPGGDRWLRLPMSRSTCS